MNYTRNCTICNKEIKYTKQCNMIRAKKKGRPCISCSQKARIIRDWNLFSGKKHTEETKEKMRNCNRDKSFFQSADYKKKQSLGVTVIESLSEQLDGSFNFSNDNGTCFELNFKHN